MALSATNTTMQDRINLGCSERVLAYEGPGGAQIEIYPGQEVVYVAADGAGNTVALATAANTQVARKFIAPSHGVSSENLFPTTESHLTPHAIGEAFTPYVPKVSTDWKVRVDNSAGGVPLVLAQGDRLGLTAGGGNYEKKTVDQTFLYGDAPWELIVGTTIPANSYGLVDVRRV
jgi:hypothetical protein